MPQYHCPTSGFGLTKWYVDVIDDRGACCIAYWALVRWKKLSFAYSAVLFDGSHSEHIFSIAPPCVAGDVLTWKAKPLDLDVDLRRAAPAFEMQLYESPAGSVWWRCEMPAAAGHVRVGAREMRGRGYAEVLEMTIAPWRLPIDELRWGRFGSMTWIDWKGELPLTVVLIDGRRTDGTVNDDGVTAGDFTLSLSGNVVIRSASLGQSLASMRSLTRLVPSRILRASETKWASRATMSRRDAIIDRGWAIHELVKFA